MVVSLVFMLVDKAVYAPHHLLAMLLYVALFSVFGQFGDLVKDSFNLLFTDSGEIPSASDLHSIYLSTAFFASF